MDAWQFCTILLAVLAIDSITSQTDQDLKEYCHLETFNASCPAGEVLLMQSARFGRMKVGRCLATSYYVGCYADVMSLLDNRCSGKQNCSVQVLDPDLLKYQPCRKDLMAYLEASYVCIKVPQARRGCTAKGYFELTSPSGYLLFGKGNIIGTYSCPWSIRIDKGQRLEFTAYDFRTWRSKDSGTSSEGDTAATSGVEHEDTCAQTLMFQDNSEKDKRELCPGGDRISTIYTSQTNAIQVFLQHRFPVLDEYTFLVSYRAIGCPDLQTAPDLWVRRTEKTAVVTCNRTRETWHLVCREDTWIGDLKNCSQGPHFSNNHKMDGAPYRFHYGILIAVALGLILGILLGTVMLVCMMSYRRKNDTQPTAVGEMCHEKECWITSGRSREGKVPCPTKKGKAFRSPPPAGSGMHNCLDQELLALSPDLPMINRRRQRLRRNKPYPLLGDSAIDDKGIMRVATCSIKGDNTSVEGTLTSDLEDEKSRGHSVQMSNASQELLQGDDGPDVIYSPRAGIGFRCQSGCVACNGPAALNRAGADYIYGRLGRPVQQADGNSTKYRTQNIELKNLRTGSVTLPRNENDSNKMAAV